MEEKKALEGRRIAVLAEDIYEDLELWYPVLRLREEGATVTILGTGRDRYKGKHGYPVTVDGSVKGASPGDYDAVVIPGGYAPDRLRRSREVLELVAGMDRAGKTVAAICHAAWVPISAGIVKGRTLTCFEAIKDDVVNAGGEYVDREVARDGNLVTSRKPSDLGAFCRAIIASVASGPAASRG